MQNCFDKSLICDTLHLVDNCVRSAGASPRFSFLRAPKPAVPSPNQPKTRPLESINCEMQFLQFLSFDIHMKWWGVGAHTFNRDVHRSREQNTPSAAKADTASMSAASGRSCVTLGDLVRAASYAFFARAPVCRGASRSIPWHAHSNSIAIMFRKLTSMRPSRRAPLIPMDT